MSMRRPISLFAAVLAVAFLVSVPLSANAQRKQAGAKNESSTPQSEMKKGGKPRLFVAAAAGTNESWTNDITRQTLEEALVNSGRFEVIAGTQRDNLLREQGFSNSDLVDPAQATKVGRMLSAKYVVSATCQSITQTDKKSGTGGALGGMFGRAGSVADKASEKNKQKVSATIQVQMTDLEKGTILLAKTYNLDNSTESSGFEQRSTDDPKEAGYRTIVQNAAQQFVNGLNAAVPVEALVVSVDGNQVILNKGTSGGIQNGMRLEIYSEDAPIKDPSTGEVLGYKTSKYAVVVVTDAQERLSYAEVRKTFTNNSPDAAPDPSKIIEQMSARSMPAGGGDGGATPAADNGKKKKDKGN
jgi:curli biogenesis system outer membrane secretion channel CsgG